MSQLNYYCKACTSVNVHVFGSDKEIQALKDVSHQCPECGDQLVGGFGKLPNKQLPVKELAPYEFINFVAGMGMPDETVTHIEPVLGMLKSSPIAEVKAHERDERLIIQWIRLKNGVTLHFAATGHGATIYKATRRKKCQ